MKLACQEQLVPGDDLRDKLAKLESWGYEGVELLGGDLRERARAVERALRGRKIRAASICAGYRGCLLDPDPAMRALAMTDIKELLAVGSDLGAAGLIVVPIFGKARLPDATPLFDAQEFERRLFLRQLEELAATAAAVGCAIFVEPLNRYETHWINRLAQAVDLVRRVRSDRVLVMADFFHMNIEEADIAASIKKAGSHIGHVHLADSNRLLPGHGHIDFRLGFTALKEIGFDGYLALESGVSGDPEPALARCAEYLRSLV